MNLELLMSPPVRMTDNEVNNLIYSLIKFGFRNINQALNSPPNSVIKDIMLSVTDDPSVDNIIEVTFNTVVREYNIQLPQKHVDGVKEHMSVVARLFMAEPFHLRDDLGEDKDADEFITKH